jgi:hypothetical protein
MKTFANVHLTLVVAQAIAIAILFWIGPKSSGDFSINLLPVLCILFAVTLSPVLLGSSIYAWFKYGIWWPAAAWVGASSAVALIAVAIRAVL